MARRRRDNRVVPKAPTRPQEEPYEEVLAPEAMVHVDGLDEASVLRAPWSTAEVLAFPSARGGATDTRPYLSSLGPYELEGLVGRGSMGEVYRARDTRLDRIVAIKILPRDRTQDLLFQQRLQQEARSISALSHPHICTLHDIGQQGDVHYLVMEFLEGETLAKRLDRGPLPLEEVFRYAIQIASGLGMAHQHAIVHRDLKPGNVMLTKSGAKLLDFGLAFEGVASPLKIRQRFRRERHPLTLDGVMVGTYQYMAPEQLEGKSAGPASDVFSFGIVMYEMLTSQRPFEGEDDSELAIAVLTSQPRPLVELRQDVPAALARTINICLAKDPEDRWQTAHDLKLELEGILDARNYPQTPQKRSVMLLAVIGLLGLGLLAMGLLLAWALVRDTWAHKEPTRVAILPPPGNRFASTGADAGPAVLSPDGRYIAFVGTSAAGRHLFVRPLASVDATKIPGSEGARFQFWAPNSRSIGFFSRGKLHRVDVSGQGYKVVCEVDYARGGAWSGRGVILIGRTNGPLLQVPDTGGEPKPVTSLSGENTEGHRWPVFLPDGKHFLYFAAKATSTLKDQAGDIFIASLDGGEANLLLRSESDVAFSGEYVLFLQGRTLMAQRLSTRSYTLQGEPVPIAKDVVYDSLIWKGTFSASRNGVLAYQAAPSVNTSQLEIFDIGGKNVSTPAAQLNVEWVRASRDGRRLVADSYHELTRRRDLWVYDLRKSTARRLTYSFTHNSFPVWSHDDKQIAYAVRDNAGSKLYLTDVNTTGEETRVLRVKGSATPTDWSLDGKYIAYTYVPPDGGGNGDIWILPLRGEEHPFAFVQSPASEGSAMFSPDGGWIAYAARELGRDEVYVTSFPVRRGTRQISVAGGASPRWSRSGRELYFLALDRWLMSVSVQVRAGNYYFGKPRRLFLTNARTPYSGFDVFPNGRRFIINADTREEAPPLTVVLNWTLDLRD
jgi:eukaryotic-like serine/threonine-protein kinase